MEHDRIKTDIATFQNNTWHSKDRYAAIIERAAKLLADPDKANRVKASECVVCFYGSKIGGAAITSQPCGLCGEMMDFGSTCTDNFCLKCASEHSLCKHCGADVNLKTRRKDWPDASASIEEDE